MSYNVDRVNQFNFSVKVRFKYLSCMVSTLILILSNRMIFTTDSRIILEDFMPRVGTSSWYRLFKSCDLPMSTILVFWVWLGMACVYF